VAGAGRTPKLLYKTGGRVVAAVMAPHDMQFFFTAFECGLFGF